MRYGFIGLGHLGGRLAASLVRGGLPVTVHDLRHERAEPLIAAGAAWADGPLALGRAVDAVITCLPSPAATTAVLTGEHGVLAGLPEGGTWIEMGTNELQTTWRLAEEAAQHGVRALEAPVTGGVHRAAAGDITILVGGEADLFALHLPALEAMGGEVILMGPLGHAATIKVVTNMLALVHLVAAGEALMLARRAGLDLGLAYHAIRASSGNSFVHETESQVILNGSYNINFTMELACKDLGFAMQLGRDLGVPLDLASQAMQTFVRARACYGGEAWSSMVVKLLEDALHTDLRAPGFPAELVA